MVWHQKDFYPAPKLTFLFYTFTNKFPLFITDIFVPLYLLPPFTIPFQSRYTLPKPYRFLYLTLYQNLTFSEYKEST
nr:MAG TPA: hypothetical protein [Caudoviricetes sp.]